MKTIGKFIYLRLNLIFYVKRFTIWLLSAIFVTLIACSSQSVIAYDAALIGVDIIPTKDSEFQVHLRTIVRDSQGQLISVTEGRSGWTTVALPGNTIDGIIKIDDKQMITTLTDNVFGVEVKKEIITMYNTKYEKVQWIVPNESISCEEEICFRNRGVINFYGDFNEFGFLNIPLFQAMTSTVIVGESDTITNQWTVLREMGG